VLGQVLSGPVTPSEQDASPIIEAPSRTVLINIFPTSLQDSPSRRATLARWVK
jgi:hypothetical protein